MQRALTVLLLTIIVSSTGLMATTYFQDRAEMRKNAGKLFQDNNHAEAMQIFRSTGGRRREYRHRTDGRFSAAL